ncbi:MAG: alpha/beta hydrolase [Chloroflexi bacterium]|nr:alpha/beta hydrolase [Chloroflexota bacterium]
MPLDPQARAYLDAGAVLGLKAPRDSTPEEARAGALKRRHHFGIPPIPVAKVEDRAVPGPAGEIPIQIYTPEAAGPLPVLVYYHGGGWVSGCIETHENACRALANLTPCVVVSVEYRRAPETKFPGPLEDCYAATSWVSEHASEIGADAARLAVGGDSAGGNLAAAVALLARERGGPTVAYQLLIYPVTDCNFETVSYREAAEGYGLTQDSMRYFWEMYTPDEADAANPLASVLRADLSGLPPAHLLTAEYDPLRDEGDAYAAKLKAAGVEVDHVTYPGQIHGFFNVGTMMKTGEVAVERAAKAMAKALAPAGVA